MHIEGFLRKTLSSKHFRSLRTITSALREPHRCSRGAGALRGRPPCRGAFRGPLSCWRPANAAQDPPSRPLEPNGLQGVRWCSGRPCLPPQPWTCFPNARHPLSPLWPTTASPQPGRGRWFLGRVKPLLLLGHLGQASFESLALGGDEEQCGQDPIFQNLAKLRVELYIFFC